MTQLNIPFDPNKSTLYSSEELWNGYDSIPENNTSLDWKIYKYFVGKSKYSPSREELISQRTHDANIEIAINNFLNVDETALPVGRKVVVLVGSHSIYRDDARYKKAAELTFELYKAGYYVVSGGGPGLMEATHLGVWMSKYSMDELNDAISIISNSTKPIAGSNLKQYEMPDYWKKSLEIIAKYPNGNDSLGIPTWFYGHEGANAFSTHIAKFFSNAQREEKICAIGVNGVIFLPGGPGTAQEVFVDAAENGYASYNWYSPMVFYSEEQTSKDEKALVEKLLAGKKYETYSMIGESKNPHEVISFLDSHPPINANPIVKSIQNFNLFRRAD